MEAPKYLWKKKLKVPEVSQNIERVYIERGNLKILPFTQNRDFTYMNM